MSAGRPNPMATDQEPTDEHCPAVADGQHCEAWWDGDQCHWCQAPAMSAEERTALGMAPALESREGTT